MSLTDDFEDIVSYLELLFSSNMATRSGFSGIKPPSPLDADNKTIRDTWRRCKQQWKDYCIVQVIAERPLEFRRLYLGKPSDVMLSTS